MPLGGYRWDPPNQESPLTWMWTANLLHPEVFDYDLRAEMREAYRVLYDYELSDADIDEILWIEMQGRHGALRSVRGPMSSRALSVPGIGAGALPLGAFPVMLIGLLIAMLYAIGAGRFDVALGPDHRDPVAASLGSDRPSGDDGCAHRRTGPPPRACCSPRCRALPWPSAARPWQGVFRNPLVSPQVLGISQGGAFGGALAILLGYHGVVLLGMSFTFGLLALVLVGLLARINGRTEVLTVILAGMIVGAFFAALVSVLQFLADPNSSLPAIVYWLMGSFSTATWPRLGLAVPGMVIGLVMLWALRYRLNLLALEESEARSLGVDPDRERWLVFVARHADDGNQRRRCRRDRLDRAGHPPMPPRLIVGEDHRLLIPASGASRGDLSRARRYPGTYSDRSRDPPSAS